ncbi:MAG: hypothetical protein ACJAUL_002119 [Paraglaciecola sp.]|jgi:hypothetical protein
MVNVLMEYGFLLAEMAFAYYDYQHVLVTY